MGSHMVPQVLNMCVYSSGLELEGAVFTIHSLLACSGLSDNVSYHENFAAGRRVVVNNIRELCYIPAREDGIELCDIDSRNGPSIGRSVGDVQFTMYLLY